MILEDWLWYPSVSKWALHCRLSIPVVTSDEVLAVTDWYFLVDEIYPWGDVKVHPAKINGISRTYQHQIYNSYGDNDEPWRNGNICVNNSTYILGRGYSNEPYESRERLAWNVKRTIDWLIDAKNGTLIKPGEPFELPYPPSRVNVPRVIFCEDESTFKLWNTKHDTFLGLVYFFISSTIKDTLLVDRFCGSNGQEIFRIDWGANFESKRSNPLIGIWLRFNEPLVLPPWQVPFNWGEISTAADAQGIDFLGAIRKIASHLRDGKPHVLLIGFPIPEFVGDKQVRMHWQSIEFPILRPGKSSIPKGFRDNESGCWQRDKTQIFRNSNSIGWLRTENWNSSEIRSRGQLANSILSERVLLIGAGAVGSVIAELLVRGGVKELTILDDDKVEIGNLVRHSLSMESIGRSKAEALADKLTNLSPHLKVKGFIKKIKSMDGEVIDLVGNSGIIIDCSASDDVLYILSTYSWPSKRFFFSISIGLQARRTFMYSSFSVNFPHNSFMEEMSKWHEKEREESKNVPFPMEGIGCWHPVFPARADDIWLTASVAVKYINEILTKPAGNQLVVFEHIGDIGCFAGIRRI